MRRGIILLSKRAVQASCQGKLLENMYLFSFPDPLDSLVENGGYTNSQGKLFEFLRGEGIEGNI